jgi:OPA family glycerol-3-phosphate transporter-like MFS transporter/OPA family sugar phosphate sensor protein UhpC-like MFS transporter
MEPSPDTITPTVGAPRRLAFLKLFDPAPPAAVRVTNPAQIDAEYASWRRQVLISTIIGYALFYFVRKNLSVAMPVMGKDLGITKSDLGLFLTLHGVLYGVSKFANGPLADRSNGRTFMLTGLVLSALMNVFFGFSSAVATLGTFWMLNGWVQGMGFPPIARLMTHWFPPKELATKMSMWNTSHSIGAGLVVVLCGYLVVYNWRLCFFVPAALALVGAACLWFWLADTPESVGLPEVEGTKSSETSEESRADFKAFIWKKVFCNKYMWLVGLANFFVYTIRYAVLDWGPTLLTETKGVKLTHAGWMVASFEISGVFGMLLGGWLTDRVFGGRGSRACLFYMVGAGAAIFLFWKTPAYWAGTSTTLLCLAGFFIYGPQALIGIIGANLATKRAAGTAAGFTGIFGYASTIVSGWGLGALVEHHGWDAGFKGLVWVSAIGALLFAAAWRARAHGYEEEHSATS